jgi:hypothetical protein
LKNKNGSGNRNSALPEKFFADCDPKVFNSPMLVQRFKLKNESPPEITFL